MRRLGDLVIARTLLAITLPRQGGRRFRILAFRTTVQDNPHRSTPLAREATGVGSFLRYSRIDALPQLINVLRGEISMLDISLLD